MKNEGRGRLARAPLHSTAAYTKSHASKGYIRVDPGPDIVNAVIRTVNREFAWVSASWHHVSRVTWSPSRKPHLKFALTTRTTLWPTSDASRGPSTQLPPAFVLNVGAWVLRGRLLMVPVHGDDHRCQAEIPPIVLLRFPEPALSLLAHRLFENLQADLPITILRISSKIEAGSSRSIRTAPSSAKACATATQLFAPTR